MTLAGTCNRCGQCCMVNGLRCQNLIITGRLGEPMATACAIHASRWNGMPITMFDAEGRAVLVASCHQNDDKEVTAIVDRGIGHGCSLILEEDL